MFCFLWSPDERQKCYNIEDIKRQKCYNIEDIDVIWFGAQGWRVNDSKTYDYYDKKTYNNELKVLTKKLDPMHFVCFENSLSVANIVPYRDIACVRKQKITDISYAHGSFKYFDRKDIYRSYFDPSHYKIWLSDGSQFEYYVYSGGEYPGPRTLLENLKNSKTLFLYENKKCDFFF